MCEIVRKRAYVPVSVMKCLRHHHGTSVIIKLYRKLAVYERLSRTRNSTATLDSCDPIEEPNSDFHKTVFEAILDLLSAPGNNMALDRAFMSCGELMLHPCI